jgi:hypothetical protein
MNLETDTFCHFYFHSSWQGHHPICQGNHMQKGFPLFLQDTGYKKTNDGSQMIKWFTPS